ncbi:MAG: parallel beta-helix repeat (two copies) [Candidatus Nitrotoga sp. SPKER]|nr:MAG: parallel beta-helix repeat (two copies) [Candidatus Nitrotoga sp. SPKER]
MFCIFLRHIVFLHFFLCSSILQAASIVTANADNYRELLTRLKPGNTLVLQPGVYKKGLPVHQLHGNKDKPVIIMGPSNGPLPVFSARLGHNTISIINASYIVIRNLELDGQGIAVDGIKCEGNADWAHHITLENLVIKGHGNNQQTVGISTKCPAWNWIIRNNTILGAGTGIYLGNSDGNAAKIMFNIFPLI